MKKLMKRTLTIVLALMMCVSMLNLTAFAATNRYYEGQKITGHDGKTYTLHKTECGGWYYTYNDATTGYKDWKYVVQSGEDGKHKDTNSHDHQCDYCNVWMWLPEHVDQGHKDPTCTEDGYDYLQCTQPGCSVVVKTWNTIPKLDHKQNGVDQWHVIEQAVPATCTTAGKTAVEECSICHARRGGNPISALRHDLVTDVAVAPNCVATGTAAGQHCQRAGCNYRTGGGTVAALGHDWGAWAPTTGHESESHTRTCQRDHCDGNAANPGTQTDIHTAFTWPTTWQTCTTSEAEANSTLTFAEGDVAEKQTRTCSTCHYSETQYRKQGATSFVVHHYLEGTTTSVATDESFSISKGGAAVTKGVKSGITGYTAVANQSNVTFNWGDTVTEKAFYYSRNSHNLTVEYTGLDNAPATVTKPENTTEEKGFGTEIGAPEVPEIPGYTSTVSNYPDTMPDQDVTITVTYQAIEYTQTIHYVYANGNTASADVVRPFTVETLATLGEATSPVIGGYTADQMAVPAPAALADETVTVTYSEIIPDTYSLYIRYVYEDGTTAAASYNNAQMTEGQGYNVASPAIEGYTPNMTVVSGIMGTRHLTFTVVYTADDVEIDEPDVPLVDQPDEPDVPDETEIDEPDVPLVELPDEIEIDDPDVPLADVPQTGDSTVMWVSVAAVSGIGLAWLAVDSRKRREDAE